MMNTKYKRILQHTETDNDFWPSFTDLLTTILLVILLVFTLWIFQMSQDVEAGKKEIETARAEIELSKAKLREKEQIIEKVIGVKASIIRDLDEAFSESNLKVDINPKTGAISFADGVFFEYNSSVVSTAGKKHLESFVPKYLSILMSPNNKEYISQIIVEGHTDNKGNYLYNLQLSQARSLAVVSTILGDPFPLKNKTEIRYLLTSNGRSFSEPIKDKSGKINANKSRRVEFQFRLKDEEMMEEIGELLKK